MWLDSIVYFIVIWIQIVYLKTSFNIVSVRVSYQLGNYEQSWGTLLRHLKYKQLFLKIFNSINEATKPYLLQVGGYFGHPDIVSEQL